MEPVPTEEASRGRGTGQEERWCSVSAKGRVSMSGEQEAQTPQVRGAEQVLSLWKNLERSESHKEHERLEGKTKRVPTMTADEVRTGGRRQITRHFYV